LSTKGGRKAAFFHVRDALRGAHRGSGSLRTSLVFEPPKIGAMRAGILPGTDRFDSPV